MVIVEQKKKNPSHPYNIPIAGQNVEEVLYTFCILYTVYCIQLHTFSGESKSMARAEGPLVTRPGAGGRRGRTWGHSVKSTVVGLCSK